MPVITVFGLPKSTLADLKEFREDLERVMTKTRPLGLREGMITFFFPKDMMPSPSKEITIFVDGLLMKPERTDAVRKELAHKIGWTTKMRFPLARVECFVRPFDPARGFWSSK